MSRQEAESSGEQSSSALIRTGACLLTHVVVTTDGSNAGTLIIYDNTSAAGKVVWRQKVDGSENIGGRNWTYPIRCNIGLYAAISGSNAKYIVEWMV